MYYVQIQGVILTLVDIKTGQFLSSPRVCKNIFFMKILIIQ